MSEVRNKKRVLVVHDDPVIANTLALILHQSGFETRAAHCAEMAVEAATELKPDVLISDAELGPESGIDTAIRVRRDLPECRVILLSEPAATADLLKKAKREGNFFEVLIKPVHPETFLARLHNPN